MLRGAQPVSWDHSGKIDQSLETQRTERNLFRTDRKVEGMSRAAARIMARRTAFQAVGSPDPISEFSGTDATPEKPKGVGVRVSFVPHSPGVPMTAIMRAGYQAREQSRVEALTILRKILTKRLNLNDEDQYVKTVDRALRDPEKAIQILQEFKQQNSGDGAGQAVPPVAPA
jgi:hypothetical protein